MRMPGLPGKSSVDKPATGVSRRAALRGVGVATVALGAGAAAACTSDAKSSTASSSTAPSATPEKNAVKIDNSTGSSADLTKPVTGIDMFDSYARTIAQTAYTWGWPLVNMRNRHDQITQAPKPVLLNGILPAAPQGHLAMLSNYIDPAETFVTCPNQDVVYGLAYFDLDAQPVIAQVPDFGDRFWVYSLYDHRTDQFGQLGKPYGTKPGFYLLAGPNWKGDTPKGVEAVIRSTTRIANAIPRVFMDSTPEDHTAIQEVLNKVMIYPLSDFDGKSKTTDWAKLPSVDSPSSDGGGETKWVVPEKFFDEFASVLDQVPPLPGEEGLYGQFRSMLDAADKNPALKQLLTDTAIATENDLIKQFFAWKHNGVPAGNGWNRSVNNAQYGLDYFNRTGTSKSNMFDNRPTETQYFYTDNDATGAPLDGNRGYSVTFPAGQEPPVEGFWSLTLYNDKHLFNPNELKRYSLGTKNKNLKRNPDGSLTLYAGAHSPGPDRESNWLPAPSGPFSLYIRAYWGKEPILDGSWQPPAIQPA
ncbi:DUF1254 domain-containing protein [Nocardia tengchongensis]|uniref:DUF1254 domain-containing protein n=1 Tax=Nocardia tengchongensis TaxID=2055889 RepID=UPI0036B6241C